MNKQEQFIQDLGAKDEDKTFICAHTGEIKVMKISEMIKLYHMEQTENYSEMFDFSDHD